MKWITLVGITFIFFVATPERKTSDKYAVQEQKQEQKSKEPKWTMKDRIRYAKRGNDPSQWDMSLFKEDVDALKRRSWPTNPPLSYYPAPVPKYGGRSGGGIGKGELKIGDRKIISTFFGWGRNKFNAHMPVTDRSHGLVTYLNLYVLTDQPDPKKQARHIVSRNYPHVLASGKQKTSKGHVDWVFMGLANGDSYAIINQRIFDLNAGGRTILVAPQKDGSLRFLQLDDTPKSFAPGKAREIFDDYSKRLAGDKKVVEFFTNKNVIDLPQKEGKEQNQ